MRNFPSSFLLPSLFPIRIAVTFAHLGGAITCLKSKKNRAADYRGGPF